MKIECIEGHIKILQAVSADVHAVLPGSISGMPVEEIGDKALKPGIEAEGGREVTMTCGIVSGEWDNRSIVSLRLPESILHIGDYAFADCRKLERLFISDRIESVGVRAFMNCRSFTNLFVNETHSQALCTVSEIVKELSSELTVTAEHNNTAVLRLLFPEYYEEYTQKGPTQFFDYNIEGAGYPYHFVLGKKHAEIADYDALWKDFNVTESETETAALLAWYRIRLPYGLNEQAGKSYRDFLKDKTKVVYPAVLKENDLTGLRMLLEISGNPDEFSEYALNLEKTRANTGFTAVLLESRRHSSPAGRRRYEL